METLAHKIEQWARETPQGVALWTQQGAQVSFEHLWEHVRRTAGYLRAQGVEPGARVLVMVPPGLGFLVVNYALLHTGAVPVLIDPGMGLKAFLRCAQSTAPSALIGIPKALALRRICFRALGSVKQTLTAKACLQAQADPWDTGWADADSGAILFTSGSTGSPKGVWTTQGQILAQAQSLQAHYRIEPGEVDVPLLAAFALYNPLWGMTTVFPKIPTRKPSALNPVQVVKVLEHYRATNSFGSPVLWQKLTAFCERTGIRLTSLRRILIAGAPLPAQLAQALSRVAPQAIIHSPYGATEALPVASIDHPTLLKETATQTAQGAGTCVGQPLPGVEVRICQLEGLAATPEAALPPGHIGEIWVQGAVVSTRYATHPEATAYAKARDEQGRLWHRMGDLGYQDAKGRLWFCGRRIEAVRTPQRVFYTDCCEAPFNTLPGVRRCALIGLGDQQKEPALAVEPEFWPLLPWQKRRLQAALKTQAAAFEHTQGLKRFLFVRRFPVDRRHNAKIHRLALARQLQ